MSAALSRYPEKHRAKRLPAGMMFPRAQHDELVTAAAPPGWNRPTIINIITTKV